MNQKTIAYTFLTLSFFFIFAFFLSTQLNYKNKIFQTCQFVSERIYIDSKALDPWLWDCRNQSSRWERGRKHPLALTNQILSELKVSHLKVYDEVASSQLWDDWSKENGIVSKFVNAELVVTEVIPKSPAARKGIRRGDRALTFNGEEAFPDHLRYGKGEFEFKRLQEVFKVHLEPEKVEYDVRIQFKALGLKQFLIKVPSFKATYFTEFDFKTMVQQANKYENLIVDLRGNSGGNFVAGLKFLSLFTCGIVQVGKIVRPKFNNFPENFFLDDLDDEQQIEILNSSSVINLKTFADYPCLTKGKKIKIIIDSDTASTAELVANALRELFAFKIYGAASSGELLVGVWHHLGDIWNQNIKITIPEALFYSLGNKEIEGVGVSVDKVIYDRVEDYQAGEDSWLKQVQEEK